MDHVIKIAAIAIGGAAGAVSRYLVGISPIGTALNGFPLQTFLINTTGSFMIGLLMVVFSERPEVGEPMRAAVIVGFLGAFTTFSTFEWELVELTRSQEYLTAFAYLALSVAVGFAGVIAGVWVGRRF